ncbi:MAG: S-layer homology domain-containing protein [Clostridiales bacterium]|jgi:C1A family cysteine protease|nr:S-layer homology domain-containing protein [Clostridiales bacterium]
MLKRLAAIFISFLIAAANAPLAVAYAQDVPAQPEAIISPLFDEPEYGSTSGHLPSSSYLPPQPARPRTREILPSSYNADVSGILFQSPVKYQGTANGLCWAFSGTSAIESSILKNNGQLLDFSEVHAAFSLSGSGGNSLGFNIEPYNGGNQNKLTAYLMRGLMRGLVLEADDPLTEPHVQFALRNSSVTQSKPVSYTVPGAYHITDEYDNNTSLAIGALSSEKQDIVKAAIQNFGAVVTSIHMDDNTAGNNDNSPHYNKTTASFYNGADAMPNHDVILVGWDNAYSKANFKTQPSSDGAWLAKNSYGQDFGHSGYFWISFSDLIAGNDAYAYDPAEIANPIEKIYEYDPFGYTAYASYSSHPPAYAGNVFVAEDAETLTKIKLFAPIAGDSISIYVDGNPVLEGSISIDTANPVQTVTAKYAGYFTVDIPDMQLNAGQKFAVVAKYERGYWGLEMPFDSNQAEQSAGQSFTKTGSSSWTDVSAPSERVSYNICIKAVSVPAPQIASVGWTGLSANGEAGLADTTELYLTFDADPETLSLDDISLSGADKSSLSGSGTARTLSISNLSVNEGESVTVTLIDPSGYEITPKSKSATVHRYIPAAPEITTASLPGGTVGEPYSQTLQATGSSPISWSLDGGSLPQGLELSGSSGLISGTPSAAGSSTFSIKAMNSAGSDAVELSIIVSPAASAPEITTASLPAGTVGESYSQTLQATGTAPISWSLDGGSLPQGLELSGSSGLISGTPSAVGSSTFSIKVANAAGEDVKEFSIEIAAPKNLVTISSEGSGSTGGGQYAEGDVVYIDAGSPPSEKRFKEWTSIPAVAFADSESASTSFIMISSPVTATAIFEAIPATVEQVAVTPEFVVLQPGSSFKFSASVTGANNPPQDVAWSVTGATSSLTSISADGTLAVAADETSVELTVRASAALTGYTEVYAEAFATISYAPPPEASVTGVTVTPGWISLGRGDSYAFSAAVTGENSPPQDVEWSVSGSSGSTSISRSGTLNIGEDESSQNLRVTATSTFSGYTNISGSAIVIVESEPETPTYRLTLAADTGGIIKGGSSGYYKAGEIVEIEAQAIEGYAFKGWNSTYGGVFEDPQSASTTFEMPANETSVAAMFALVDESDEDAPVVLGVSPSGTGIAISGRIIVDFSEPMNDKAGIVKLNSVALGAGNWSSGGSRISIPYSGLSYNTRYVVEISEFEDEAGNLLSSNSSFGFTTGIINAGNSPAEYPVSYGGGGGGSSLSISPQLTVPASDGKVAVDYIKSGSSVALSLDESKVDEIIRNSAASALLDISKVSGATEAVLPKSAIAAFAFENLGVEILLPTASIKLSGEAAQSLAAREAGENITFEVSKALSASLSAAQSNLAAGRPLYSFAVRDGGTVVENFSGAVKVSLTYELETGENPNSLVVYQLDGLGGLKALLSSRYNAQSNSISFDAQSSALYAVGYNPVSFSDVPAGFWGAGAIEKVAALGLVAGVGNGNFEPERQIKRAEFVQMMYSILELSAREEAAFDDVSSADWFSGSVSAAKSEGLLNGLTLKDGNFSPEEFITRQEMAVILANSAAYAGLNKGLPEGGIMFVDEELADPSYTSYIEKVSSLGLMVGISEREALFEPTGTATRAQAAQVMLQMLNLIVEK